MPTFAYLLHLGFRFMSTPLLSKMCSDKTGGLNDGLPQALTPIFGEYFHLKHGKVNSNLIFFGWL